VNEYSDSHFLYCKILAGNTCRFQSNSLLPEVAPPNDRSAMLD
jgi:hypothetical protein